MVFVPCMYVTYYNKNFQFNVIKLINFENYTLCIRHKYIRKFENKSFNNFPAINNFKWNVKEDIPFVFKSH